MAKKKRMADVMARYYLVVKATGIVEEEGEYGFYIDEKEYDRIKESYNSGCFKQLHEDKTLQDLIEMFEGDVKTSISQRVDIDYPDAIKNGLSFDEAYEEYKS